MIAVAIIVAVVFSVLGRLAAQPSAAAEPAGGARAGLAGPVGPNVDFVPLRPGEKPPQFVLFSFDGSGSHEKWQEFLAAAEPSGAQFTGFLSGVYLLTSDHGSQYTGPGHAPGKSSIGFGGTARDVRLLIGDLNTAYQRGMEIGSHYNGHFCDGNDPSGNNWTTAQWSAELDQFDRLLRDYRTLTAMPDLPELAFGPSEIRGGRTPCLEGDPKVFFPALAAHGQTYDTSQPVTGLIWPQRLDGLWEFGMPVVPVQATNGKNIAMDYNFWYQLNGTRDEPARAAEFTSAVLATYRQMYTAAFNGNRAPLVIGNHFNNWSGNAFNPAAEQFMREVCGRPQTICTTYQNVVGWMQAQDPAVLAGLLARPPADS